jgi:HEAT repeat protein
MRKPIALLGLISLAGCQGPAAGPTDPLRSTAYNQAITLLLAQFRSGDPVVRANCIEALQLAPDPRAAEPIEQGLHDSAWVVRFAAAMAAGRRKAANLRPVIEPLATTDPNGSVRAACVYALRRFGDTSHMTELAGAVAAADVSTRANTALILGLLGDESAIPLLKSRRSDADIRVRFEITAALARLGDDQARQVIAGWAVNRFAEDQWTAMTVCGDLPAAVAMSPLLLGLQPAPRLPADAPRGLSAPEIQALTTRRQLVAARSLAKLRNGAGAKVAIDNLSNPDASLRALALLALGEMLEPERVPGIEPLLADPDDAVKRAAAAAVVTVFARAGGGPGA